MALKVRGLSSQLRPEATLLLMVRCAPRIAASVENALALAAGDLRELDGGWMSSPGLKPGDRNGPRYVSEPIPTPLGPMLMADLGSTPRNLLAGIPDLVLARLADAGINDAVVQPPPVMSDRYTTVTAFEPAVGAWWYGAFTAPFGSAPREIPLYLLDLADAWLRAEAPPEVQPIELVISAEIPITWQTLRPAAEPILRAGVEGGPVLVASDFTSRAAAVSLNALDHTHPAVGLIWAAKGPADLARVMLRRREAIHAAAAAGTPLAWAGVTALPDARSMLTGSSYRNPERDAPADQVERIADTVVPDGLWYQVLTAGHLDRFGGLPPGAVPIGESAAELTIGEPEQWLPGNPARRHVQREARNLLANLLIYRRDHLHQLSQAALQRAQHRGGNHFFRA